MRRAAPAGDGGGGGPSHVRSLYEFWAARTFQPQAIPLPSPQARVLLDTLGIGIEQVATYLRDRPDYAAFETWILATAGRPDPDKLARYHAWLAGDPAPPATRDRLTMIDAMADVLDPDDMAMWESDGVVVLRDAIAPQEAKAAEMLLWRELNAAPDDPTTWYDRTTQGIMFQLFQAPEMEPARRSPRVHKAFAQLFGTADLWTSTDRLSFNPPETPHHRFPGPHLHWDTSVAQPIPLSLGGILYLTDTAADQGALRVVRGFHRRIGAWLAEIGDDDPRQTDFSAQTTTVPGRAGDLVIWRSEILHGASANRTTRPRMAQYVTMYPPDWVEHDLWR